MFLELMIKGFIVGIAFIIPGVSGGTLAIYLGIYKKLLDAIGNIFTHFKESMKFLIPFGIGVVLSVLGLAKLFGILIEWNSFIVLMFFIGLLAGGIKQIIQKADLKSFHWSSLLSLILSFGILITIIIIDKSQSADGIEFFELNPADYFLIIGLGIVSATTMIVPGISGSAMLMVLGFYTAIVTNVIGNVLDLSNFSYNFQVLVFFAIGIAIGIIGFSKLISFLLERFPKQTYMAILGFVLASMIGVFLEIKDPASHPSYESQTPIYENLWAYISNHIGIVLIGLLMGLVGYVCTKFLSKIELKGVQNES
jgi:putative membrane protein